jgi:hypothetical protein
MMLSAVPFRRGAHGSAHNLRRAESWRAIPTPVRVKRAVELVVACQRESHAVRSPSPIPSAQTSSPASQRARLVRLGSRSRVPASHVS